MRIFLSYRRNDSQQVARAMKEFLDGVRRVKDVFLDFDGIEPGSPDFVTRIDKALAKSDAAIIVIGRDWAGMKPDGTTRLHEPGDHVRREIVRALSSGRKVFPVLVDGAAMPAEHQLPDDLKPLSRINAVQLRTTKFKGDMVDLLNAIAGKQDKGLGYWKRPPITIGGFLARVMVGVGLAAVSLIGILAWMDASATARGVCGTLNCLLAQYVGGLSEEELNQYSGAVINQRYRGLSMTVTGLVLLLGAVLPFGWRALRR